MQRRSPASPAYRACRDDCAMTQGLAESSQAEATQQQMLSTNRRLSAVLERAGGGVQVRVRPVPARPRKFRGGAAPPPCAVVSQPEEPVCGR